MSPDLAREFPPVVYVDLIYSDNPEPHRMRTWQPWRWRALNAGNHEVLAVSSEAYTNESDCRAAITQLFGSDTNVYLRASEQGNAVLRMAVTPSAATETPTSTPEVESAAP